MANLVDCLPTGTASGRCEDVLSPKSRFVEAFQKEGGM
jgi:hypothetical protein